jgi:hypothetical protein
VDVGVEVALGVDVPSAVAVADGAFSEPFEPPPQPKALAKSNTTT